MNNIDIDPQLIPLKYRIKGLNSYSGEEDIISKISSIFIKMLTKTRKRKAKTYEGDELENSIVRKEWSLLQSSTDNPLRCFKNSFFELSIDRYVRDHFGDKFSKHAEEVLRDNFITDLEKQFIIERGLEYGYEEKEIKEKIDSFLDNYNPAFRKIVLDICEDDVITDVEKKYLFEKAFSHNISSGYLKDELMKALGVTKTIHSSLLNGKHYGWILTFMLYRFCYPRFIDQQYLLAKNLFESLENNTYNDDFLKIISNTEKQISFRLNQILGYDYYDSNTFNPYEYLKSIGIAVSFPENEFEDSELKLQKLSNTIDEIVLEYEHSKESGKISINIVESNLFHNENSNDIYEYSHRKFIIKYPPMNDNEPLFSFDVFGNEVHIHVNRASHIFSDNLIFKKILISIVENSITTATDSEFDVDVQNLFRAPYFLRKNCGKSKTVIK
jgi:hypothetical protein